MDFEKWVKKTTEKIYELLNNYNIYVYYCDNDDNLYIYFFSDLIYNEIIKSEKIDVDYEDILMELCDFFLAIDPEYNSISFNDRCSIFKDKNENINNKIYMLSEYLKKELLGKGQETN